MSQTEELHFTYKNYRGEVGRRRVRLEDIHVRFGATHYHPEPQLIFRAFDLDKEAVREFALRDMDFRDEATITEDTWLDPDTETMWTRPTAYAYAMVCKARDRWHEEAKQWDINVSTILEVEDSDVVRVCEGGGEEDLKMSLVVSMMKTRKMRDDALRNVGKLLAVIDSMRKSAERVFFEQWRAAGIWDYILRQNGREGAVQLRASAKLGDALDFINSHREVDDGGNADKA